jgi:multidrug efflux pump subunit AcrB
MLKTGIWLERKKAFLCLLMALCVLSLCVIFSDGMGYGGVNKTGADSYSVTIRHYGIDAAEMERSVAIPLEDALLRIPGVTGVLSSAENSMARVFVRFSGKARGQYEALREAAQQVYESLPQSAQRPEIAGSDNSRIPVWAAAVSATGNRDDVFSIEKTVKPRLEKLEGAGEVLVSGAGPLEVIVVPDQEKIAALGLTPSAIAVVLGMNDALFPGGLLVQGDREIIVTVDGRIGSGENRSVSELGDMPIPIGEGKTITLSEIAVVFEQERKPDTYSRINGKRATVISIMGVAGADLRKLSKNIKKELSDPSLPFEFTVLSDRGAEEADALRSVFGAAGQGALMVALVCFFLNRRKIGEDSQSKNLSSVGLTGFFCAISVPAICLVSAAVLSAGGMTPNRNVLAGIAAGVGTAVDAIILCSEKLKRCKNFTDARSSLQRLHGPLIAGSVTTVAALLPVPAMGQGDAGVIAVSIAVVTFVALFFSLCPMPPLLLWGLQPTGLRRIYQRIERINTNGFTNRFKIIIDYLHSFTAFVFRKVCRFLAVNTGFCVKHPRVVVIVGVIVSVIGITALLIKSVDSGTYGSDNSVYAHVEFEGGLLAEEIDRLLADYGEDLSVKHGIDNVETAAKTGSGSVLISFDPKIINVDKARELARQIPIPGAFLFFPETASKERYWEIKIFGDDDKKCREIAEGLARSFAASPLVKQRVLNFKQGSQRLNLFPDREKFAALGLTFFETADTVRRGVHGPVAYKRISTQGETDVRIRLGDTSGEALSKSQTLGILAGMYGDQRLDSLVTTEESYEPSSIRREDRRRTASITIVTNPEDPRRMKEKLAGFLEGQILPPGYSVEFDPEAIRRAEALSKTALYFLLALLFCYMVLAAVNESFTVPFAIIFTIPPSLAVPAIFITITGLPFNIAAACAFVAVSGMTVNAAVLCASGLRENLKQMNGKNPLRLYLSLRRNLPALVATTVTTIAGAVPFLFLKEGVNLLVKTMAMVTVFGVGCSCLCAVSVLPALLVLMRKNPPERIKFFS